ncbi:MAG: LysE/ArgO family amino acid transporter [Rhizobiaceae bacterium]
MGVIDFGTIVQSSETLLFAITVGGAIFLACYAVLAARRAITPTTLKAAKAGPGSLKRAIAFVLCFTYLNPYVYLDTVVPVGGISGQYEGSAHLAFATGAMATSGHGCLGRFIAKATAWRILDGFIALVMAAISISLFLRAFA